MTLLLTRTTLTRTDEPSPIGSRGAAGDIRYGRLRSARVLPPRHGAYRVTVPFVMGGGTRLLGTGLWARAQGAAATIHATA